MVMLAHVRSAFALSNGTYGSPRMTRELQDDGFAIGHRRTARLMRENGLRRPAEAHPSGSTPRPTTPAQRSSNELRHAEHLRLQLSGESPNCLKIWIGFGP